MEEFIESEEINNNHGWQTVTKKKKNKSKSINHHQLPPKPLSNGSAIAENSNNNVFSVIEKKSEERRKVIEAQRSANYDSDHDHDHRVKNVKKNKKKKEDYDYDESDEDEEEVVKENGGGNDVVELKKPKPKKVKKPKVTVAEAAAKIDNDELTSFLLDVTTSFEAQQDIQLMRFADYFGRAFSNVTASQFPWVKLLRESPVAKVADNPVSHIPEAVYKTSVDWINKQSMEALGSFFLWSLDGILADLAIQQGGGKGSKKGAPKTSSKSQVVGLFVVLAMVLRRLPDVLISVVSWTRKTPTYCVDGCAGITRRPGCRVIFVVAFDIAYSWDQIRLQSTDQRSNIAVS